MVENAATINVSKIRGDFPILKRIVNGKSLVYLDNAATSQKPDYVLNAIVEYYRNKNANVHRGIHKLGEEATIAYEEARGKVAKFIGSRHTEEIVFVRNATEGLNLIAMTWGRANIKKGDKILLTIMEHHSNIVPWQMLAKETGAKIEFIEIDTDGSLREDQIRDKIDTTTKLVSITHASNVLGTINAIDEIAKEAHRVGALFAVDAAQSVPHMPVNVKDMDCDFLVFSGHKMLGPTGIGVLYGKKRLLEDMPPFLGGGEMIREVHTDGATWKDTPYKFEAGTPNAAGAVGLGAATEYLSSIGMKHIHDYERELTAYAFEKITRVGGIVTYGPKDPNRRVGVITFNLGDIHAHDLATILDEEGIAIRSGHHCAQPLMEYLGVPATSRVSFYLYNTREEVDVLISALEKARMLFNL
ncbi:MAG TPA: cysteine desulfurase [Methylomirabilota bacterium]|nr:cysteine desulfurase [Methylomirabilota bacterium]